MVSEVRDALGLTEADFNAEFGPVEDEIDRTAALKREQEKALVIDFDAVKASVADLNADEREELIQLAQNESRRADNRAFYDALEKVGGAVPRAKVA